MLYVYFLGKKTSLREECMDLVHHRVFGWFFAGSISGYGTGMVVEDGVTFSHVYPAQNQSMFVGWECMDCYTWGENPKAEKQVGDGTWHETAHSAVAIPRKKVCKTRGGITLAQISCNDNGGNCTDRQQHHVVCISIAEGTPVVSPLCNGCELGFTFLADCGRKPQVYSNWEHASTKVVL